MTIVLLTFIAVFALIASGVALLAYRSAMASRMARVSTPLRAPAVAVDLDLGYDRATHGALDRVIDPLHKVVPRSPREVSIVQKRLMLAGFRKDRHVEIFYAAKVMTPAALFLLATVTGAYSYGPFFVYSLALAFGFLGPDFWVGYRIRKRQLAIRLGLPEALDLLTICVEAGLGLDQAILRVAEEQRLGQPILAEELNLVNLEQRAGKPRTEALHNLAERTDVDSIRALTAMLIQTDHFGTSVADSLRVHADGLRTQRRQEIEEQAAKTTIKLIFPLIFLIFPSLFVVTLGPAVIKIMESFERYF
jgi:tight adherence protein C